jgi:exosortase K
VKTKLGVLAVVALVIWGMKRHYADARAEDLWWILHPTARLVGRMTNTAFVMVPGEGYVSDERLFVIEKSCAGVNFMIAAFGMAAVALLHRVKSGVSGAAVLALSLSASYGAALMVNAARITIALWLAAYPVSTTFSAAQVHRVEGVVVYFAALLLMYELVTRIERGADLSEQKQ